MNDKKEKKKGATDIFNRFANATARAAGQPWTFMFALLIVITWILSGPIFHYSDTWQLVINTGTTIITFLMVFLIQNTQNRDSEAFHIKLDELIWAVDKANDDFISAENMTQEDLDRLKENFEVIAKKARKLQSRPT